MSPLEEHVRQFNSGVRSGDWRPMLEQFAPDAELAFVGVPVGPFVGREEIEQAYRERLPDDQLDLVDERREGETVVAGYAWRRDRHRRTGELRLTVDDYAIARVVVTFEDEPARR